MSTAPDPDGHDDQAEPFETRIDSLGIEGDGVSRQSGTALRIRYALPGETILARPLARNRMVAERILTASPDRVVPPCPLFGRCGGCVVQHMSPSASLAWKTRLLTEALQAAGFAIPTNVRSVQSPPAARRRIDLAIRRQAGGVVVGLHVRGAEQVVPMSVCHVLHPILLELVVALPTVLNRLQGLRRAGSIGVNLFDSGPDILLSTDAALGSRDRAILADFAEKQGIPRISWHAETRPAPPEPICLRAPVSHRLSGIGIVPPPGAFLQATREGEAAIVGAVLAGLPERLPHSARVVELYAGCGTIGLPLSEHVGVTAYEGHAAAVASLKSASVGRRLSINQRDLNRQPLSVAELAGAAAIVLDPPHAGAGAQAPRLAGSDVSTIIYVSCNPASLAQDARCLAEAGYHLERLTIIDQFLWSARVESVSVFRRSSRTRRGPMPRPPK